MNRGINYYDVLGLDRNSTDNEIKLAYRSLSKKYHPDKNIGNVEAENIFKNIAEAYSILSNVEKKAEYDTKSKFGKNYDEYFELFDINVDFSYEDEKTKLETFKRNEVWNIQIEIDDSFNGSIEYERWVKCKKCDGSGKDLSAKIILRDDKGNITKMLDADDGCDFCFEGHNEVITDNGPVNISDIKLGDFVLSSNNEYFEVVKLMDRNYSGYIYDIDVCGIKINGVTPNHKLNVVRFNRNSQGRINRSIYSILELPVDELKVDDFIIYQKRSYNSNSNDLIILDSTINRNMSEIKIDNDFIRFIACYIAEGNTRGNRVTVITMHIDKDKELINFIKEYVVNKLNSNIKTFQNKSWGDKVLKIEIFNSQLSKFLNGFCGHTAINKYINTKILDISDQLLLDTLLLCDGYIKGSLRTYVTISEKLANQVLHIALGLGHNASISKYNGYIDKNGVNHKECYRVYITYSQDLKKDGLYNKKIKEGTCIKVKNISKRLVSNVKVYNITVDKTHKYTINGLLVNNCEGTGKDYTGGKCSFCQGMGKVGMTDCKTCNGEKRILGKQKLNGIKLTGDETKIDAMGHFAKNEPGKVGYLLLIKK